MHNYAKMQRHRASPDTAFENSLEMYVKKSMCLEQVARMTGIVAKHGWGNFQIDQKGALALEQKIMPPDLSEQIGKAISDLTKIYLEACRTNEAMAAGWGLVAQPASPPVP